MPINRFEDLTVYQKSMTLAGEIYGITKDGAFAKDWGLRDQLRKAAVSIISNIAEGYERGSIPEYRRFLLIAKGSSGEVRAQLLLARKLGYLCPEKADSLIESCVEVTRMLAGVAKKIQGTRNKDTRDKIQDTR